MENNIIPKESLWDGVNEGDGFWDFIERYHPNYNCDEIASIDDIHRVLDHDYDENDPSIQYYLGWSEEELLEEERYLNNKIFEEAYATYLYQSRMQEINISRYMDHQNYHI